jgi:hypothetical protein
MVLKIRRILIAGLLACPLAALAQQPTPPANLVVNTPCNDGPKMVGGKPEAASTTEDAEGFRSLFNGKDLTGWWEDCKTPHSNSNSDGAFWFVDPAQGILFSKQKDGGIGGLLATNENFGNYEFIFDIWPIYGNDGGVFNRTTPNGKCWQTTIDYITGSGVGGGYNENSWAGSENMNHDPIRFDNGDALPSVQSWKTGAATNPVTYTWTTLTKQAGDPTTFGCSANGCVGTDFAKIWDLQGWNQIRIKFYNGLTAGTEVHVETFIRKAGAANWVPVYKNQKGIATPAAPVAFQVHNGPRWKSGTYNLYKNMKIRALDNEGNPITVGIGHAMNKAALRNLKVIDGVVSGELPSPQEFVLRDVTGKVLETFSAGAGAIRHAFGSNAHGLLILEIRNGHGVDHIRFARL